MNRTLARQSDFACASSTRGKLAACLAVAAALVAGAPCAVPPAAHFTYTLLPDSHLLDDCPPCGRPTILEPLRGTFELRQVEENPLFMRYALTSIAFTAGSTAGRVYRVTGHGSYIVGGEVALRQELSLEVQIDDGVTNRLCYLTNATPAVGRPWPMLEATAVQTNGTFTQVYQLHLSAAPFRELWFTTAHGMTSGRWPPPTNRLSGGDWLSSAGRVVKWNRELTQRLGVMPIVPDLGLDAVDVRPGGEVVFSIEADIFSEFLGPLHHGDLLSNRGRIVQRNQQLTAAFIQMPPAPDAGLDAVQLMDAGEVWFSIEKDFFSEALGRPIRRGDLLSSRGLIVKSNEQLVARFQPADASRDYGLDALHVWPGGEVWFSVEEGFQGRDLATYQAGDLLSDQGYVVFRNLDLVNPFQPLEDLADFGLDGLFIVTDAAPARPGPRFTRIQRTPAMGVTELQWDASGRVFQVQRAAVVDGLFLPVSEIIPDLLFNDPGAVEPRAFYRLQQW